MSTLILSQAYIRVEKVHLMFILSGVLGTGNREPGTCRASASSMLREGDWSHVQDTTFPGFRRTPRAGMNSPRLSRFLLAEFPRLVFRGCKKIDIILRQRTRTYKF